MRTPVNAHLQALRAKVHAIEASRAHAVAGLDFGISLLDERLGGGLGRAALHEIAGTSSALNDDAAATLFTAGIAARACSEGQGTILWIRSKPDLFAPALEQAGLPPHRLIHAECRRNEDLLAAMEEGLRHGGLSAVVAEIGVASMTATRRIQLAAEDGGTIGLMLKRWRRSGQDPLALPSAAATRWRIGCVPSGELPASGVSRPRWKVELVRQRGGLADEWILEGTDEAGRLALPAGPAYRSAAADRGTARQAA
jgi:protein ImuA